MVNVGKYTSPMDPMGYINWMHRNIEPKIFSQMVGFLMVMIYPWDPNP